MLCSAQVCPGVPCTMLVLGGFGGQGAQLPTLLTACHCPLYKGAGLDHSLGIGVLEGSSKAESLPRRRMQDQGHNRTHQAQDTATTLFPTAQHLLFTRNAGKVHSPSLLHVPGPERPPYPGHKTGRISPQHWDPAGVGDSLEQRVLLCQHGGLGGEGLQGLYWLMVALGPYPLPTWVPSLHCYDNRHPNLMGPFTALGELLMSLHTSWQGRHKRNSSSSSDPQAGQDEGNALGRAGHRQLPPSACKELDKPGGKQLQGCQTASGPQFCPQSDNKFPA